MRRRPRQGINLAIPTRQVPNFSPLPKTGIVLSGGGARAAYQVGALKALLPYIEDKNNPHCISVVIGSSIGAINGLILSACLQTGFGPAISQLEEMWRKRTFRNTFSGTPSQAFFRAVKMAVMQYLAPGPNATSDAIFDPTPLMTEVDHIIEKYGGLAPDTRFKSLEAVGVMTTVEGAERKPLLFVSTKSPVDKAVLGGASFQICEVPKLTAKHGFASAALPSVLPPVELDFEGGTIRLVDGGIAQNIPVDPAVRLGADRIIIVDVSGRDWWLDRYNEAHDTRPTWEVPAGMETFCMRPPETFVSRINQPLGKLLKQCVGGSRKKFMEALGPVWPVFTLLKQKLGEEIAYEAMTYVALDEDFLHGVIEQGFNETLTKLRRLGSLSYSRSENYDKWMEEI